MTRRPAARPGEEKALPLPPESAAAFREKRRHFQGKALQLLRKT